MLPATPRIFSLPSFVRVLLAMSFTSSSRLTSLSSSLDELDSLWDSIELANDSFYLTSLSLPPMSETMVASELFFCLSNIERN